MVEVAAGSDVGIRFCPVECIAVAGKATAAIDVGLAAAALAAPSAFLVDSVAAGFAAAAGAGDASFPAEFMMVKRAVYTSMPFA